MDATLVLTDSTFHGEPIIMNRQYGILVGFLLLTCSIRALCDEGMFPLSELDRLSLEQKGLELSPSDLFNPGKISLVNGICRVNGCTGTFVSDRGLIITNHHCAYEAIQNASTAENDLLEKGFAAQVHGEEIPAPGYTVRITESYQDISEQVLAAVHDAMPFVERSKAMEKRRKELEQEAEKAHPGLRAEVAEMFAGKTYVLFFYTYLKDIRLVFAPPAAVGNFGGEADNWEWPRHTGDFSFLRAYTAPDGSSATFSADNVPYRPKRFIQVDPRGVDEEDFVFLLGYPGRTLRHKTASFLRYEQEVRLPTIVDLYAWQISEMEKAGANDRAVAIQLSSRIKSLANVVKRSRGQLLGLRRAGIVESRLRDELQLQSYIDSDPQRREKYDSLLQDIDAVHDEMVISGPQEIHLRELRSACRALSFAFLLYDAAVERSKPDLERESPYMDRNFDQTTQQLKLDVKDWHGPTDEIILAGMLERIGELANTKKGSWQPAYNGERADEAKALIAGTRVGEIEFVEQCLTKTQAELEALDDTAIQLIVELYPTYKEMRNTDKEREGRLDQLYGSLIDVKQAFLATDFVPDANGTLRITYGRVRGYSPADAIFKTPISTLQGVIEKTTGQDPFITPPAVIERYQARDFGRFVHPKSGQVPVAILYNTDTTGGNSGSPVLSSRGQLVGVNFDRTFEATINDFAWNESYSRSIGVDIRYVLWITGNVYHADHLLKEMGIEKE